MAFHLTRSAVAPSSKWCGQTQPHGAHAWVTKQNTYAQCGGHR